MSETEGATRDVSALISTMTSPGKQKKEEKNTEGEKVKSLERVHHPHPASALPRRVQGHEHLYPEREKKERGRQSKLNSPSSNSQDNQKTQVKKQVQYRPQGLALETRKK